MRLESHEIPDVARFFAKRYPAPAQRAALARTARVHHVEVVQHEAHVAWEGLLRGAQAEGRLHLLAHAAARGAGDDANLRGVCAVLTGTPNPGTVPLLQRPGALPALAALALATVGGGLALALRPGSDAAPEPAALAASAPAAAPALVSVDALGGGSSPADKPWKAGNPLDTPRAPVTPEAAAAAAPPPASAGTSRDPRPAHHHGRCTLEGGGIVGYWYAGSARPGAAGATITVPNSVNVRADYPDTHNDFDARAPVRCTLAEGDRLHLTADPIAVPGGAYWVPLHSGDLVVD